MRPVKSFRKLIFASYIVLARTGENLPQLGLQSEHADATSELGSYRMEGHCRYLIRRDFASSGSTFVVKFGLIGVSCDS